ncbi:hypothetical protein G7Y89_g8712 [Cudoniella acicularis]|uniref:Uncharacterized protein n=1 Tax=Cudoniella acicularis TaxID=354080 RepID=A0A8H4RG34_9HELO|nr:hypothetical protein G7Y89_g8712 [Cudoniella acicularis]
MVRDQEVDLASEGNQEIDTSSRISRKTIVIAILRTIQLVWKILEPTDSFGDTNYYTVCWVYHPLFDGIATSVFQGDFFHTFGTDHTP